MNGACTSVGIASSYFYIYSPPFLSFKIKNVCMHIYSLHQEPIKRQRRMTTTNAHKNAGVFFFFFLHGPNKAIYSYIGKIFQFGSGSRRC